MAFTGTRDGLTLIQRAALRAWLAVEKPTELHHGDCVGADEAVHSLAWANGMRIHVHPGDTAGLRAHSTGYHVLHPVKPNLKRNDDILDAGDMLVAAVNGPEVLRSGTWSTVRKARRRRMQIAIFWPNGAITVEAPIDYDALYADVAERFPKVLKRLGEL